MDLEAMIWSPFQKALGKLGRFSWTLHNLVGHPVSEVMFQLGFEKVSNSIHDLTIPQHNLEEGRG